MSSGCAVQHIYFSTHNALRNGVDEDDRVWLTVSELNGGPRQASFMVYPFYDIEMVKRLVIKKLELPPSTNVSELRIFFRGSELPNHRSLTPFVDDREHFCRVRLHWTFRDVDTRVGLRETGLRSPPALQNLVNEVNLGLQRGVNPKLTMDGTGGTYRLYNGQRQNVAMFKPQDEEAFAPNNPRGYEGQLGQKGFRSGVVSGEGSWREVAAFLLDAQYGSLAGVPQTTKVEACHPSFCYKSLEAPHPSTSSWPAFASSRLQSPPELKGGRDDANEMQGYWKEGSFQEFVDAKDTCGDYDPRVFALTDAHYIGILDLCVLNLDRNDGNILVTSRVSSELKLQTSSASHHHTSSRGGNSFLDRMSSVDDGLTPEGKVSKYRLIPIDHGLILPDTMEVGDIDLVWFYWPQSKTPFSQATLRYIFSIDPDRDASRLKRKLQIRDDCLRTMRVATRVVQIGARMHLNLHQIASLVVRRDDFETPSVIERSVKTALIQAWTAVSSSSLVQQARLPGSLLFDLHLPRGGTATLSNTQTAVETADTGAEACFSSSSAVEGGGTTAPRCAGVAHVSSRGAKQTRSVTKGQRNSEAEIPSCRNPAVAVGVFGSERVEGRPYKGRSLGGLARGKHGSKGRTEVHTLPIPEESLNEEETDFEHQDQKRQNPTFALSDPTAHSKEASCTLGTHVNKGDDGRCLSRASFGFGSESGSESLTSYSSVSSSWSNSDEEPNSCSFQTVSQNSAKQTESNLALKDPGGVLLEQGLGARERGEAARLTEVQPLQGASCMHPSTNQAGRSLHPSSAGLPLLPACIAAPPTTVTSATAPTIPAALSTATATQSTSGAELFCTATRFAARKNTTNAYGEQISARLGTAPRRRPTALHGRGTTSRNMGKTNNTGTWCLLDSNRKPVPLDWSNLTFEKTFFECFEMLIRRHIMEAHPQWRTYAFNGEEVLRELEATWQTSRGIDHSDHRHHHHHHHHHHHRHRHHPQACASSGEAPAPSSSTAPFNSDTAASASNNVKTFSSFSASTTHTVGFRSGSDTYNNPSCSPSLATTYHPPLPPPSRGGVIEKQSRISHAKPVASSSSPSSAVDHSPLSATSLHYNAQYPYGGNASTRASESFSSLHPSTREPMNPVLGGLQQVDSKQRHSPAVLAMGERGDLQRHTDTKLARSKAHGTTTRDLLA